MEAHAVELERQRANLRAVVTSLESLLARVQQPVAELEKSLRKISSSTSFASPRPSPALEASRPLATPAAVDSPAPRPSIARRLFDTPSHETPPRTVDITVSSMSPMELTICALECAQFLEMDVARKRLLCATHDLLVSVEAQQFAATWECSTCDSWARILEIALQVAGTLEAVQ